MLVFDDAKHIDPLLKPDDVLIGSGRVAERDIYNALKDLGHEVKLLSVTTDLEYVIEQVKAYEPDLIFNQAEQMCGDPTFEAHLVALFEMMQVPYTGCNAAGITLCKNKGIAKKILSHHRIKTAAFSVYKKGKKINNRKKLKFPLIVKPLTEEASYGISQSSLVENDQQLKDRVAFIHDSMNCPAIAEEYIHGRELYVALLGNDRVEAFPPRELVFKELEDEDPRIATFKAKWDDKYRKKWGIKNEFAQLDESLIEKIEKISKKVYRHLLLNGYCRLDLRLTPQNEVVIIEANPNPFLARDEDFSLSAKKGGYAYKDLIEKIVSLGVGR